VFWGGLIILMVAILFLFWGPFHWASKDPGIDREIAKQRFQAEQELRGLHRSSGSGCTSTQASRRPLSISPKTSFEVTGSQHAFLAI